ncbi:D-alanyl-D-alanine carboxypeptidase family protein [Streptomyces sp. ST2-7A]|uniref:D-alanyl-D-alanine carboxypeptidase family protein n=1 Tax=Streptomyces sp. ST2-7A TaxID=2907214 RepID=UPI001F410B72|nr:D-alanyl-D-alanine carboxypeptidase [Streptomyces sp. ST2-7A]MCE7078657.1 D-alanyl-D-alanine carboxypeptidase [Streptomyces sp. ST2-7A]
MTGDGRTVRTPRGAGRRRTGLVLGTLLLPGLLLATPATAADSTEGSRPAPGAAVPASSGTTTGAGSPAAPSGVIGGEQLGLRGTRVQPLKGAPALPKTTARSWIVADADTGEVLAARDAHRRLAPASTLKMLFADTLLADTDPEDVYRADPLDFGRLGAGSSAVGISDGHDYTVEDLWHGVFLASGNDAVHALSAMNGGLDEVTRRMNERAVELQAMDTTVVNPDGYDGEGQLSSAYDLTLIARAGLENPEFRRYAAVETYAFPGKGKGKKRESFEIRSTNRLLVGAAGLDRYPGILGGKNGYTSKAGHTFTGIAERDGRTMIVTVMNPEDGDRLRVYRETADLLDWGFGATGRVEPIGELVPSLTELAEAAAAEAAAAPQPDGTGVTAGANGEAGATGAGTGGIGAVGILLLSATTLTAAALWGRRLFHRRRPLPGRRRRAFPRA